MYLRYIIIKSIPLLEEELMYQLKRLCNIISIPGAIFDKKNYLLIYQHLDDLPSIILKERDPKKAIGMLHLFYHKDDWDSMYLIDEGRILIIEL